MEHVTGWLRPLSIIRSSPVWGAMPEQAPSGPAMVCPANCIH